MPLSAQPGLKEIVVTCYRRVGDLRALFELYEVSLRQEFYHNWEIVEEWRSMIGRLHKAIFPLQHFLLEVEEKYPEFFQATEPELRQLEGQLAQARAHFQAEKEDAYEMLHTVLRELTRIGGTLAEWQHRMKEQWEVEESELKSEIDLDDATVPGKKEMERQLNQAMKRMERARDGRDDLERCRASRLLFLMLYDTFVVHPSLWTTTIRQKVIELHEQTLQKMTDGGHAKSSTKKRLDELLNLDHNTFNIKALNPPQTTAA